MGNRFIPRVVMDEDITDDHLIEFLKALARGHTITKAAAEAKLRREQVMNRRESDPEFAEAWDVARESGTDYLEELMINAAAKGQHAATWKLLTTRRPEYKETSVKISGAVTVTPDIKALERAREMGMDEAFRLGAAAQVAGYLEAVDKADEIVIDDDDDDDDQE